MSGRTPRKAAQKANKLFKSLVKDEIKDDNSSEEEDKIHEPEQAIHINKDETRIKDKGTKISNARIIKYKKKSIRSTSQEDSDFELALIGEGSVDDDISDECEEDIDPEDHEGMRKFKIRQANREHAKKLRVLRYWSDYWSGPEKRTSNPYATRFANAVIADGKKLSCPLAGCLKSFTTRQGVEYHYKRCNLETKYRCKLCQVEPNTFITNGEILRHLIKIHLDELPCLPQKFMNDLDYYFKKLNDPASYSRKFAKDIGEAACHESLKSCKIFYDHFHGNDERYLHWLPKKQAWLLMHTSSEISNFSLPEKESVNIKTSDEESWMKLSIGQVEHISNHDNKTQEQGEDSYIFYVGGVPSSSSWCPIPSKHIISNCDIKEHIAISVSCTDMNTSRTFKDAKLEAGIIQLWSFNTTSALDLETDVKLRCEPKLEFGIAHQFGHIWDMSWCPGGTAWQQPTSIPSSEDELPRLGLLAIACGDGQVRILSIPHPESLTQLHRKNSLPSECDIRLYNVYPVANLKAPGVGSSTDYHPTICKCICWSVINNQGLIAAGYGNGHVAVFDLTTRSQILFSQQEDRYVLRPLKSWIAHGGAVTALSWSPYDKPHLLVTGGYDRNIKFWNLEDIDACLIYEKSPVTKIHWDYRNRGIIASFDNAFTSFTNRVLYRYPIKDGWEGSTTNVHRATVCDISSSAITNAVASCDNAGEVLILPSFIQKAMKIKRDSSTLSRHSVYSLVPLPLDNSEITYIEKLSKEDASKDMLVNESFNESVMDDKSDEEDIQQTNDKYAAYRPPKFLLPSSYRPISSYHEFKLDFGLKFIPYKSNVDNEKDLPESSRRGNDIKQLYCDRVCDYPFSSITGVMWSPNISSYPYLLTTTQVGVCRIDKVNIIYKLNRSFASQVFSER